MNNNLILTYDDFSLCISKLKKSNLLAFDIITENYKNINSEIIGITFSINNYHGYCILLKGNQYLFDLELIFNELKCIFENNKIIKICFNSKRVINILFNYNIKISGLKYDVCIEYYLLKGKSSYNILDFFYLIKNKYFYNEDIDFIPDTKKSLSHHLPINIFTINLIKNICLIFRFHEVMWNEISNNSNEKMIFEQIEMPLSNVLAKIEYDGIYIDLNFVTNFKKELICKLKKVQELIYEEAKTEFNINSSKQLRELLYEKLLYPVFKKTSTGANSTAEDVLQLLSADYKLPKMVLEYRNINKLKSTYVDVLLEKTNLKTNRIHTSYDQITATTGRIISHDPNLQNIPNRTEFSRNIRRAFISSKGNKIISMDYSQIELRVMAHISKDTELIFSFNNEIDIHCMVASEIFKISINEVTNLQRQQAKTINFGLIYGMSAFGLSKNLGINIKMAQQYIDLYFDRFCGVLNYMQNTCDFVNKYGFVNTLCGHRIYINNTNRKNHNKLSSNERIAINAPIQGSAAEIIKIAMIKIHNWISNCNFKINMIMQIHDELIFEVEEKYTNTAIKEIKNFMEHSIILNVPLSVNIRIGNNLYEAY